MHRGSNLNFLIVLTFVCSFLSDEVLSFFLLQEIPYHLHAIEFGTDLDGTQDFFQLFWPIVLSHRSFAHLHPLSQVICPPSSFVMHISFQTAWKPWFFIRIDENSPLWEVSPKDLLTETFEIVLTMEGTTPETGNNIQVWILILTIFTLCHEIQNLIFCIRSSKLI